MKESGIKSNRFVDGGCDGLRLLFEPVCVQLCGAL